MAMEGFRVCLDKGLSEHKYNGYYRRARNTNRPYRTPDTNRVTPWTTSPSWATNVPICRLYWSRAPSAKANTSRPPHPGSSVARGTCTVLPALSTWKLIQCPRPTVRRSTMASGGQTTAPQLDTGLAAAPSSAAMSVAYVATPQLATRFAGLSTCLKSSTVLLL